MYTPVNPYIALAEIIEELKMNPSDVDEKPLLKDELLRAIDRGSRWVDSYTQRDYFFHDFSATPLVFDQYSDKVFGFEIFAPFKPIIALTQLTLGADEATGTPLVLNQDYYNDDKRIYLLRSSRMFVQNVDIPHDGAAGLHIGPNRGGWCLSRPDRMLFVRGQGGYPQANKYQMTATGDAATQTDSWIISSYSTPTRLYWTMKLSADSTEVLIVITSDAFGAQIVATGTGATGGPNVVQLQQENGSGITGQVSIAYTADSTAANTLDVTPNTATTLDTSSVPQGIDPKITLATRLVAAAFSGHNRKEIVGLDGNTTDITDRAIPKTVFQILGRQNPILV